ncbi:MFS transporter [Neptunomonas antarctica]|uniref:Predicted arabinose efflux permease, MFS family n=1 Tax=Neptunomonas antarctica TaxID=619304 RepID=A0A1N7P8S3_9GAMM|nr:MFS transporter [Neptunomonas antarctica]SIT07035.1 Predicted arabinose efflux permease, MFS family [Neptunomonas antarctica]
MIITLLPLITLFISCFILMLGFGLVGLLLPVRMGMEGMSTDTIGLILSMYAVGMLLGGLYFRRLIVRVGHIRIFSASAALAAASILACSLTMNEWVWGSMRMIMGFCIACSLAVIDGWLSDIASPTTRGRILATSQVVVTAALFCGQFLLNLAAPTSQTLFITAGILFCLALIPLIMSRRSGPVMHEMKSMSFLQLIQRSPLGVVSCFFGGLLFGAMVNMLPLFANSYDISGFELTLYMATAILGAFLLQFPVGMLSDRFDRRTVLFYLLLINIAATLVTPFSARSDLIYMMMLTTAISTGIFSCLYPMSIAETFDKIQSSEMAAAMGGLLSIYALGSILGPATSSIAMKHFGDDALFGFLAVAETLLLIFVVYRMRVSPPLPVEEQESYVMQPLVTGTPLVELHPYIQHELETPLNLEAKVAITIAESSPAAAVNMVIQIAKTSPEKAAALCAALAQVDDIDVARLFTAITRVAPDLSLEIAEALSSNAPDHTSELVTWLVEHQPEKLANIVAELASQLPTYEPEESEQLRPADADAYHESATELVAYFAEFQPDQALEVAAAIVETLPEMASEVVDILHDADGLEDELYSDIEDKPQS